MWYEKAKRQAQTLNIPGPIPGLPGYAPPALLSPKPAPSPKPSQFDPYTGAPLPDADQDGTPDSSDPQPNNPQVPEPQTPRPLQFSAPTIHERCHCIVKSLPGGRQVWRANENACGQCLTARDEFNQAQDALFSGPDALA